ncbi:MAG: ABC transporter substrate-binding protein [Bacteroidetes bacterium]|nr:ABC transporter substrate-binding protein [Bacteroidota bacterium]
MFFSGSSKNTKEAIKFLIQNLRIKCQRSFLAIFLVAVVVIQLFPVEVQGSDIEKSEKVSLHLKWMHAFQFAGYYAAAEKGYYAEEGLDVVMKEASTESKAIKAVLSGDANFGVSSSDILNYRLSGEPLVVLSVIFQHSPEIILSRKDNNIRKPSDLIGRRIMIDSDMEQATIIAMLTQEGLAVNDVTIIPHSWDLNDIIDRNVDAATGYITDQPNQMRLRGVDPFIINPIEYGIDFYGDCLFTTEEEIRQNPERVAAFRRASLKGWEYAMSNVEELIELILQMPGVGERGITAEHLRYEAEQMQELIMPKLVEIGHINPGRWKHIADTYVGLGMLDSDYSLEGFIYETDTEPNYWWMYGLLIGITAINVFAFFVWGWYHQLRKIVDRRTHDLKESETKLLEARKIAGIVQWEMDVVNERFYNFGSFFESFEINHDRDFIMVDDFLKIIHPDDRDVVKQAFKNAVETKTIYEIEHRLVSSDGQIKWVNEFGKFIYDQEGNPIRAFGTTQNITERKIAETELKLALKKATESDRLKLTFLATMSHELRTPLNAIIGFSDLISDVMPIDDIIKFSKIINSSGNHLLGIVQDLFDITLIETGEIKIVKKYTNLYPVLNNVFEIVKVEQHKTKRDTVQLNMNIPEELSDVCLYTDSLKLNQILINLLRNALKFTHQGHINFGYYLEKIEGVEMLKFYVEDTGIGIPEDKREIIFDVFRQVEDSSKREYGGAGIGLSICKKLTRLLGGEMWLESEVGKGSTFFFTIPFSGNGSAAKLSNENKCEDVNAKDSIVLIVEDDELSFKYLNTVLIKLGLKTIGANNGREAVEICKENRNIGLVLMDVNMPIMNGYEATMEIKKIRPNLPVVIQTAYAIAGDREKAFEYGGDDYISKPIKRENLVMVLEKYL